MKARTTAIVLALTILTWLAYNVRAQGARRTAGSWRARSGDTFTVSGDQGKESRFEKIAEGVYYGTGSSGGNSPVIVGDRDALIVDTKTTPAAARVFLDDLKLVANNKPVRYAEQPLSLRPCGRQPGVSGRRDRRDWARIHQVRDRQLRHPAPRAVHDVASCQWHAENRHRPEKSCGRERPSEEACTRSCARRGAQELGRLAGSQADRTQRHVQGQEDHRSWRAGGSTAVPRPRSHQRRHGRLPPQGKDRLYSAT